MIPTGGVNLATTAEFLKAGACAVAVGGELIDAKTIGEGRYEVFEERARLYLAEVAKGRAGYLLSAGFADRGRGREIRGGLPGPPGLRFGLVVTLSEWLPAPLPSRK